MQQWLVKRMLAVRATGSCTSVSLRRDLLKHHGIEVDPCTVRRVLQNAGYEWLPRAQKPRHTADVKRQRKDFANDIVAMTPRQVKAKLALCMDGVVLTMPPADTIARENFCLGGETHTWRQRDEHSLPALAACDKYRKQVPENRAVPLWGGVAAGGFSIIVFHDRRKLTAEEWAEGVEAGKLRSAIQRLSPARQNGPWTVLCDNEAFLRAPASAAAHRADDIHLLKIPPKSPDLNPVELYWSWLRRALLAKDLEDLKQGRPTLGKTAFKARVRAICASAKAKRVACACVNNLHKVCKEVLRLKGAATRF